MQDRLKFRRPVFDFITNEFQGFDYFDLSSGVYSHTLPESANLADDKWEQCTGLKDKNGNLIYEGDIIRFCLKRDGFILCYERIVIWDSDKCAFILQVLNPGVKPGTHWRLPHPDTHIIEIIGNTHTATIKDGE